MGDKDCKIPKITVEDINELFRDYIQTLSNVAEDEYPIEDLSEAVSTLTFVLKKRLNSCIETDEFGKLIETLKEKIIVKAPTRSWLWNRGFRHGDLDRINVYTELFNNMCKEKFGLSRSLSSGFHSSSDNSQPGSPQKRSE